MHRLQLDKGILVTADAYTRIIDPEDRATSPLFGDAAAATLLTRNPKWIMGKSAYGSKGEGHEKLIVRGSGSAPGAAEPLFMDGRGILEFTRKSIPASVKAALQENEVEMSGVDSFVFHQANAFVLNTLTQDLGLDPGKVVSSLSDIGNTTSSSIPIALRRVIFEGPNTLKTILISGFGVGLSWSSSLLFKLNKGEKSHET
jgi:3-oxoacyl-[acyl-carrier-protein] synthase-3